MTAGSLRSAALLGASLALGLALSPPAAATDEALKSEILTLFSESGAGVAPAARVPPRPPRRLALEPGPASPVPPGAALSSLPQPRGLPPAPTPIPPTGEQPASSALVEGLADYVVAPTDPLTGLATPSDPLAALPHTPPRAQSIPTPRRGESIPTPRSGESIPTPRGGESIPTPRGGESIPTPRGGESIEVRPLSPLDLPESAGAPEAVPDEQLASVPPAAVALPGREEPATRDLGGVLEEMMEPDSVVARVNGEEILWRAVVDSAAALPEDYRGKLESVFPALLQRLVDMKLLAQRARGAGLDGLPEVKRKVRAFEEALLREALLREMLESELSDETLRRAYEDYGAESQRHMQVKARHILLETREEAIEVIAALDDGADFAGLARERSTGASAARGGDLGVVDVARMVAPFAEALAGQPIGRHGQVPVQSDFGWHVVLVESRQGEQVPPFEQVLPQLRHALGRDLIERRLVELRGEAEIEIVEPGLGDGAPLSRLDSE